MDENRVYKMPADGYRVVSDGTIGGTRVLDSEGHPIGLVKSVNWHASADSEPTLHLEVYPGAVDLRIGDQAHNVPLVLAAHRFFTKRGGQATSQEVSAYRVFSEEEVDLLVKCGVLKREANMLTYMLAPQRVP